MSGLVLVQQEHASVQYSIFLGIFLGFVVIEALYDWLLKIPFRETMAWPVLVPYVALYVSSSYGFVGRAWADGSAGSGSIRKSHVRPWASTTRSTRRTPPTTSGVNPAARASSGATPSTRMAR